MVRCVSRYKKWPLKIWEYASLVNVILIFVIILQVFLRYGLGEGVMALEELQWHCYAIIIMLGISYADVSNSHVRVDILSERFSPRVRRAIEALGIFLFLFPFLWIVIDHGIDFTFDAYRIGESSQNPGGLTHRWVIKSLIPLAMVPLFLTSLIRLWGDDHGDQ